MIHLFVRYYIDLSSNRSSNTSSFRQSPIFDCNKAPSSENGMFESRVIITTIEHVFYKMYTNYKIIKLGSEFTSLLQNCWDLNEPIFDTRFMVWHHTITISSSPEESISGGKEECFQRNCHNEGFHSSARSQESRYKPANNQNPNEREYHGSKGQQRANTFERL